MNLSEAGGGWGAGACNVYDVRGGGGDRPGWGGGALWSGSLMKTLGWSAKCRGKKSF